MKKRRDQGSEKAPPATREGEAAGKNRGEAQRYERDLAESIIETAQIIVLVLDTQGCIVRFNPYLEEISGYALAEVQGKDWFTTFLPERERERIRRLFSSAIGGLQTRGNVNHILNKSGRELEIEWYDKTLKDRQGNVVGLLSVGQDITERRRAEEALRESEGQLALILKSAAEGIYGLDVVGNCSFCNPAALRMLGYREEQELLGKNMHNLTHHTKADGSPYPRGECLVTRTLARGDSVHSAQESLWRSDGGSFPAEYWSHPMYEHGNLAGAVVTFIDRSEHVALERQLRQIHKLEAVGQLAAGVAHDFNNILSSIIGHGHLVLMKMSKDDPPRLNVDSMLEACYQASRLVQSLLTVGRQQLTSRKPADLNAVVAGATKRLTRTMGPGVELKTAIGDEPLPVLVDAGQIELLLQNLAANAAAAMPGGGTLGVATERVVIDGGFIAAHGFGRPGPCALLIVSDTGTGMDERTQKRVFEPFFSTTDTGKNAGLELAVAYGIVKQHDGYITVSSRPGAGTTFSIYLPLLDNAVADDRKDAQDS